MRGKSLCHEETFKTDQEKSFRKEEFTLDTGAAHLISYKYKKVSQNLLPFFNQHFDWKASKPILKI